MDAGYVEGGIFVNIGDLLQMWSGDKIIAYVSLKSKKNRHGEYYW